MPNVNVSIELLFSLLADNTDAVSTSWGKRKSVEVGIPCAQTRLVLLLGDGMSHSVTRFVLLPCNWQTFPQSEKMWLRPLTSTPSTRFFRYYSGFNPPGRLPVWVRVEVDKHVEPGLIHPECFHCWAESRSCHAARSGEGWVCIGWWLCSLCCTFLQCYWLCRAKSTASTGCWSVKTEWDNVVIMSRPGTASQAKMQPVQYVCICGKESPKGQRGYESCLSFLFRSTHQRTVARTTPNNHPPHALMCSEGVAAVVFRAAARTTCCQFCFLKSHRGRLCLEIVMTKQTGY